MKIYHVVSAFIKNSNGDVLLINQLKPDRPDHCFHDGTDDDFYWTIPGGKIDPGETTEIALIREMMEETGLNIERPFTLVSRCRYLNADHLSMCDVHTYEILHWQGDIVIDDPCQRVRAATFFPLAEAVEKIGAIPYLCMREPLADYLQSAITRTDDWFYRTHDDERMERVDEQIFQQLIAM